MEHGKEKERGFGGEREVTVKENKTGRLEGLVWSITYHMTGPVKISMAEKVRLVDRMVEFVVDVKRTVGDEVKVLNLTMFPRFLRAFCSAHVRDEDAWLFDGLKRDVDEEIRKMEGKMGVKTVEWRTLMGPSNDLSLTEIRTRDFLDKDNVHLKMNMNSYAAQRTRTRRSMASMGKKRRRVE